MGERARGTSPLGILTLLGAAQFVEVGDTWWCRCGAGGWAPVDRHLHKRGCRRRPQADRYLGPPA